MFLMSFVIRAAGIRHVSGVFSRFFEGFADFRWRPRCRWFVGRGKYR
jgi:hypothetical protein